MMRLKCMQQHAGVFIYMLASEGLNKPVQLVEPAVHAEAVKHYLTMLILKASVPDKEFRVDEPLTQQYFLRRSSLALSCTCFMVAPKSTGLPLTFLVSAFLGPFARSLKQICFMRHFDANRQAANSYVQSVTT